MTEKSNTRIVLRWVAFLPAALLAAYVAWFLVMFVSRLTMGMQGINLGSFLPRVFIEFVSHAAMGAAFVYVGAKVAPVHHRIVAYLLAGLGLVAAGFLLYPAFMVADYWAIWSVISIAIGVSATAHSVSTGEVELEP